MKLQIAEVFEPLLTPKRYKVLKGGRGSGKSWTVADLLLIKGLSEPLRILCAREFQTSIKDSSWKLLSDRIKTHKLESFYTITETSIKGRNGTEFLFKGLRRNINEIKSTEGVDIVWVEEAQAVSEHSWETLTPTIRKPGSEIWVVFNPDSPDDSTYKRFVTNKPDDCILIHANYDDNPWFPEVLNRDRLFDQKNNPDLYDWKWGGQPRIMTDAQVFRGKFELLDFDSVKVDRFYFGADWGFSTDPTVLVRCFIRHGCLYIDYEAYGVHTEIPHLPKLFDSIPEARKWPIKADNARPETISYMKNQGFNISGPAKLKIEDGIEFLRGFERIYIHPRCPHVFEEFKLYSYKVDSNSGDVLPIVVDAYNHCIDSLRYALVDLIRNKNTRQSIGLVSAADLGL